MRSVSSVTSGDSNLCPGGSAGRDEQHRDERRAARSIGAAACASATHRAAFLSWGSSLRTGSHIKPPLWMGRRTSACISHVLRRFIPAYVPGFVIPRRHCRPNDAVWGSSHDPTVAQSSSTGPLSRLRRWLHCQVCVGSVCLLNSNTVTAPTKRRLSPSRISRFGT